MSGKAVRDTLTALGVIASLVFVGLEIQQSNVQARAATRQALAEISINRSLTGTTDPELGQQGSAWLDAGEDETLDCRTTRFCGFIFATLRFHENVFLQVQEGILDESAMLSYSYLEAPAYRSPFFAQFWPTTRRRFDPDFVAAFEAEYDLAP